MKRLHLAAALAFAVLPAWAEEIHPDLDPQTYVKVLEDQRDNASRRALNLQAEYTAAITVYEARLAEAMAWLAEAQKKCAEPPK